MNIHELPQGVHLDKQLCNSACASTPCDLPDPDCWVTSPEPPAPPQRHEEAIECTMYEPGHCGPANLT